MQYSLFGLNILQEDKVDLERRYCDLISGFSRYGLRIEAENFEKCRNLTFSELTSILDEKNRVNQLKADHPKFRHTMEFRDIEYLFSTIKRTLDKIGFQKQRILTEFGKIIDQNRFIKNYIHIQELSDLISEDILFLNLKSLETVEPELYLAKLIARWILSKNGVIQGCDSNLYDFKKFNEDLYNWVTSKAFAAYAYSRFELNVLPGKREKTRVFWAKEKISKFMGVAPGSFCYLSISLEKKNRGKIRDRATFRFPEKKEGILYQAKGNMIQIEHIIKFCISATGRTVDLPIYVEYIELATLLN